MGIKINADKIEFLRISRGWSKRDLARRSKVSVPSIYEVERGNNQSPKLLKKIAKALGVETEALIISNNGDL